MQLTRFSDYGLRLLMFAAAREAPGWCTVPEVAEAFDISAHHLAKVAQGLARQGYLETRRGRTGGVRLACEPQNIDVGAVLRQTEQPLPLVECFDPATDRCRIGPACRLRDHLERAHEAFFAALDGVSLQDLVMEPEPLLRLLRKA